MHEPSAEMTRTVTFVVRFWREWSGGEARWRGRIEHVESGQRADFLGVEGLVAFLERFGVGPAVSPDKGGVDHEAEGER